MKNILAVFAIAFLSGSILSGENIEPAPIGSLPEFEATYRGGSAISEQSFPHPWSANHWDSQSTVRFSVARDEHNDKALQIDTVGPQGGGQAYPWRKPLVVSGKRYLYSFQYRTTGKAQGQLELRHSPGMDLKLMPLSPIAKTTKTDEGILINLPTTGPEYATFEMQIDVAGSSGELAPFFKEADGSPDGVFQIKKTFLEKTGAVPGWTPPERPDLSTLESEDVFAGNPLILHGPKNNQALRTEIEVQGQPFESAVRFEVPNPVIESGHRRSGAHRMVSRPFPAAGSRGVKALRTRWAHTALVVPGLMASIGHWGQSSICPSILTARWWDCVLPDRPRMS